MVTCVVICGRGAFAEGVMVCTPLPLMAKLITSAPVVTLACWIAALRVHESFEVTHSLSVVSASGWSPTEFTTKGVLAWTGLLAASSIAAITTSASITSAPKWLSVRMAIVFLLIIRFVPFLGDGERHALA